MATVEVMTEEEAGRGWVYRIRVSRPGGGTTEHEVGLSWADHEYWSGGSAAPSKVVEAVVRYCVEREKGVEGAEGGRTLPAKFDASTARRWWPAIDTELSI